MTGSIGWGIVGCGDVVERKAGRAFGRIAHSELVAVMRRDPEAARAVGERLGARLATSDADEVIHHPDVDVVYVATPPAHHLEYALRVAAAGKPALIEKPAGRCLEETEQMRAAFREAGQPLFVSYYRPHLPRFARVQEILESGLLGEVTSFRYRMSKPYKKKGWSTSPEHSGGGHFYDIGCHMLDVFDSWFGPLELVGAASENVIPAGVVEDVVDLTLRSAGGALGHASWNFAAPTSGDELVVEGTLARIVMAGTSVDAPIRVELAKGGRLRRAGSRWSRRLADVTERLLGPETRTERFAKAPLPHGPMLEHVVATLRSGSGRDNADAALRTARIVDAALEPVYGPRTGAFWARAPSWNTRQARAARRIAASDDPDYLLGEAELSRFKEEGFIGPFRCDGPWERLQIPIKKGRNLHLVDPVLFDVCTHPSIVRRVAQVAAQPDLQLFKTRYVVKAPAQGREIAWHQDVGPRNGGYDANGQPLRTYVAWLALDPVDAENGALQVIPGSHHTIVGPPGNRIRTSRLVEDGDITPEDLARTVTLALAPGEFVLFDAWLLHGSGRNDSQRRRAALNMRFATTRAGGDPEPVSIPLVGEGTR